MPRAKRRCAKSARPPYGEGCRNFHPCPVHPWGWQGSTSPPLPDDWDKIKRQMSSAKRYGCAWCGSMDELQLDHVIPRFAGGGDNLANLQWLDPGCHKLKGIMDKKKYKKRGKR